MRSSVSYILSSSTAEPNMSHPDYEQYSHDHAALLVLVRSIGSQLKNFTRIFEKISRVTNIKITDSTGHVRNILVRYVKDHPLENNDWGDFQTHRRLLGLISVGKYDNQQELNEICRVHESLKVKYTNTLFDSRCILFGPTKEAPISESENKSETDPEKHTELFTTPTNFKTRALFYGDENCSDLEIHISEFINSLFWVLDSKRLERSREKLERVSLLLAPFEKKDFVGLDMESRNNKKRCTGRMTKHLGDLCLQAGLISESLTYYTNASEILKSVNDWLWLGAAYEGLCAASALVLYPNIQRNVPLHRNASLQEGSPGRRSNSITATLDEGVRQDIPNVLSPEDIAKRYRDAVIHYSKYQNAGIIETEASFKAARISVEQNHSLQAASFLQNVVYINLTLSEQEKIQRFETLSDLYTQIGFIRKAAFCQRLAASRYVSPQNASPNWNQCYLLMLQSFPGHKLSLEPYEMCAGNGQLGWPALQIQLLQELVVAAKRMGHSALATRHMTFLLQTMWDHLNVNDRREFAIQLQTLASQCEGAPVPLVLDSGIVIPPANLTNLPLCTMFQLKNLKPHLQPQKVEKVKADIGPFLFTPIHFGSLEREREREPKSKMDFLWVENDLCEVTLKLMNPLPLELRVSNMRLLTSGPVFESIPETIILPSETPTVITLNGMPKESGELEILGYSTHTLGIKSNCRLRYMKNFLPQYNIDVIPCLPTMEVKTSLPQSATFSSFNNFENVVTSASLSMFNGESTECTITLTNTSQVPIEMLEVSIQTVLEPNLQDQIFKWSQENLQSQLPLMPNCTASLTLYLYSAANFLATSFTAPEMSSGVYSSSHASSIMSVSAGPSSLPSRLHSPTQSTMGGSFHSRRNEVTSSFRSTNSGQSSIATLSCRSPGTLSMPQHSASTLVEGQLQLRYSGGPGLVAGYCRVCSIYLTLEMIPSLQITNWDVLPAETSAQFYLVLDVANLTSQEMDLQYTENKNMLIEGHESCRIPIPVKRCPLSKLTKLYMDQTAGVEECLELDKICSEHIASLVDLKWQLLSTETKGKATLKGITLTPEMLDLVRMSPLQWEVAINSEIIKPQNEVGCEPGECLQLEITVTNILERPLRQLTMTIQFYQDHQNGVNNYRLETRLAVAGATKVILPTLEPQSSAYHTCNVVFFTSGQYKIDIQSSAPECLSSGNGPTIIGSGHVWRFIPPVEVTVKD